MRAVITLFMIGLSMAVCGYIQKMTGLKDDSFAEEFVELIILNETGIDVDLSYDSPEVD